MIKCDVVFIIPSNAAATYQGLSETYSAIEPPTWALLLAESVRSVGFKPLIIDALAENISDFEVVERVKSISPRLVCFVVYGQNVNSGTTNMSGATRCAKVLKLENPNQMVAFLGSYMQALPIKTLNDEKSIDFVFTNEGVYSLRNLLGVENLNQSNLSKIKGIAWRDKDGKVVINKAESIVSNERMDLDLPGYAWDLLPYVSSPLDLYRAPLWHAEYNPEYRTPYAAIQTSLGCNFSCEFCMINTINRDNEVEIGVSGDYSKMRFWSPGFVAKQIDILVNMGVRTIRIVDEMFLLYRKHYVPLCELLSKQDYASELRMWAYSRIDTVSNPEFLKLVRSAGIRWLALGIESADRDVRLEVSKGKFQDVDIKEVVKQIHSAGIEVMANYIVGLPGDDPVKMQKTLDLSLELCTSGWNMYPAMALPGSQLYKNAIEKKLPLPSTYEGFSFHSYETIPMQSSTLSGSEILAFRDSAFSVYHSNKVFLDRIRSIFGQNAVTVIQKMSEYKLKRKLIEESYS